MANADIFISYSRKDHELVAKLVYLLEWYGYGVWWDINSLRSGEDFSQAIQKAIDDVKCVIVIWSEESVQSKWVRAEASIAENANKLLPVAVDNRAMKSIPAPSNLLHSESLEGWSGDPQDRCFQKMLEAVEHFCPQPSDQAFVPETVKSRSAPSSYAPNVFGKLGWFLSGLLVGGALGYGYFEVWSNVQGPGSEDKVQEQNTAEVKRPEKGITPGAGRFIDNGDGTVTDTQTNLMWKTCSEGQIFDTNNSFVCPGLAETYSWKEANEKFTANIQSVGYSDWRLPSREELMSLIWCSNGISSGNAGMGCGGKDDQWGNYQSPTIYQNYFPNTSLGYYISSTITRYKGKSNYWARMFNSGGMYGPYDSEDVRGSIRLVRKIKDIRFVAGNEKEELSGSNEVNISNHSFEFGSSGWGSHSKERNDYIAEVVKGVSRSGENSFHIKSKNDNAEYAYVLKVVSNKDSVSSLVGKNVHFFTYLKVSNISGHINFTTNFFSKKEEKRWYTQTADHIREDESGWVRYSLYLKIPKNSEEYNLYVNLSGQGEIWVDDFGMEILSDDAEVGELDVSLYKVDG